ncbi:MAG: hypothetical protein IMY68_09560, partial [Bacteroidetes bacterium]|nr:hypothetical protein [Bacteroidota bacterium]
MIPKSKTSWLKLILELLVVFIGVSAGFLFDNFREEQSNRKLDFISGEFVADFSVNDTELRNITAGYYTISNQKMEFVHTLDSL